MKYTIYIAGPSVFLPVAKVVGRQCVEICAKHGARGLYPISDDDSLLLVPGQERQNSRKIFNLNISKIRTADAVVADMTPFRGPGMDGGTAFEIGAAYIAGKPVFGHGPGGTYMDNVVEWAKRISPGWEPTPDASGVVYAPDGMAIENFSGVDNLMMDQAIVSYSGDFEQAVICAVDYLKKGKGSV